MLEDTLTEFCPLCPYNPICKSGGRSSVAATSLVEAGYKNIYDLGAMSNWKE